MNSRLSLGKNRAPLRTPMPVRRTWIQRKAVRRETESENNPAVPPIVSEVLRSPGQPLDAETRAFMEPRLGHDFGHVRLHRDSRAAESARAVHAQAYTVAHNIVFDRGAYSPHTRSGRQLIAHELTHALQQSDHTYSPRRELLVSGPNDATEVEAEQAAKAVVQGETFNVAQSQPMRLARRVPIPDDLPPDQRQQAEDYLAEQAVRRGRHEPPRGPTIYMCSKNLERAPVGTHAFFRVGADFPGVDTYSLEPEDRGSDCYQGEPKRNFPADVTSADARCQMTGMTLSCLQAQHSSYPIGHYCTLGPNSNTFVGHIARRCGLSNPDPPGWNPGIDDNPPPSGTFAPSPTRTLLRCTTKNCSPPRQ